MILLNSPFNVDRLNDEHRTFSSGSWDATVTACEIDFPLICSFEFALGIPAADTGGEFLHWWFLLASTQKKAKAGVSYKAVSL